MDTPFHSACLLLTGNAAEFEKKKNLFESWFHFAIAKAAYAQPLIGVSDLAKLAEQVNENYRVYYRVSYPRSWMHVSAPHNQFHFQASSSTSFITSDPLSQLVSALFRVDLQGFMRQLADLDDFWWTGAHLLDLLVNSADIQTFNIVNV